MGETRTGRGTTPARILIADDHELVRDGFKRMLDYEQDLEVVGEASNGRVAVELCRELEPDLVLMDVRMPQMDGLEATSAIKAEHPETSVLVITTYESSDYLLEAMKAGAAGYVLKDAPNERLTNAMRRVLEGEAPVDQELAAQLIQRLANEVSQPQTPSPTPGRKSPPDSTLLQEMTPRELEVLGLVARGKTNQQITESLFISKATTKVHVQRVIHKLGVSDRTQAVVRAFELGLVPYPGSES